jgi:hypothetical protein
MRKNELQSASGPALRRGVLPFGPRARTAEPAPHRTAVVCNGLQRFQQQASFRGSSGKLASEVLICNIVYSSRGKVPDAQQLGKGIRRTAARQASGQAASSAGTAGPAYLYGCMQSCRTKPSASCSCRAAVLAV